MSVVVDILDHWFSVTLCYCRGGLVVAGHVSDAGVLLRRACDLKAARKWGVLNRQAEVLDMKTGSDSNGAE